jgi:hypothetical protein
LRVLIGSETLDLLKNPLFMGRFEEFSIRLSKEVSLQVLSSSAPPYVHSLPMERDFLDFLRLSGRVVKASDEEAASLKEFTDHELDQFRDEFRLF